jgi:hypothetical protein
MHYTGSLQSPQWLSVIDYKPNNGIPSTPQSLMLLDIKALR